MPIVRQAYSISSEIGYLISRTGGKCNRPPRLATADTKRRWRNDLAKKRRFEHKEAKSLGMTRKEYKRHLHDVVVYRGFGK